MSDDPPIRMNHLMVVDGAERYGIATTAEGLAAALLRRGHGSFAVCLGEGHLAERLRAVGSQVAVLPHEPPKHFGGGPLARVRAVGAAAAAAKAFAAEAAEVTAGWGVTDVHFHRPTLLGHAGRLARRPGARCFWEMPNIVTPRPPLHPAKRLYTRACRRWGVVPLANSRYTASTLEGPRLPVRVMHLGVEAGRFDPAAVDAVPRSTPGIPLEAAVFGIVSRLHPSKGQDRFAAALGRRIAAGLDAHLVLLGGDGGTGFATAVLEAFTATGADAGRLHDVGLQEAPQRWYPLMDAHVNSRVDPEPFGLSVIEGMMMGRPCLAHALGGPAETVLDGETGWHAAGVGPADWDAALDRVLGDRGRWPALGEAARRHALEEYTTDAVARRLEAIVAEVARRRGG